MPSHYGNGKMNGDKKPKMKNGDKVKANSKMKKGSKEMKEKMAKLRSMKK